MLEERFPIERFEKPDKLEPWRKNAFAAFLALPLPSPKDEKWRYTDLAKTDFSTIRKIRKLSVKARMENVQETEGAVVFEKPYDKLDAFAQAFGEIRTFQVEKGKKARLDVEVEPEGSGAVLQTVHVGKGATLDVFVHYHGGRRDLFVEKSVFFVEEGGTVRYHAVQRFGPEVLSFAEKEFHLGKDAVGGNFHADSGATLSRTVLRHHFDGNGSSQSENKSAYFCKKGQHVDLTTEALHHAVGTKSDILVKGVLGEGGSSVYRGVIRIDKKASGTDSYLQDRVIHLGQNALSHSVPSLFIDNNDVSASHGASVAKISPDALFYLRSRGLSRKKAEKLVVDGFLEEVLSALPEERLNKLLRKDWEEKTGEPHGR